MKPLPNDPYAFQERVMSALIGDIADTGAAGFPRMDALRATSIATKSAPDAPLNWREEEPGAEGAAE